jgi:hypothetical protein
LPRLLSILGQGHRSRVDPDRRTVRCTCRSRGFICSADPALPAHSSARLCEPKSAIVRRASPRLCVRSCHARQDRSPIR